MINLSDGGSVRDGTYKFTSPWDTMEGGMGDAGY